MKVRMCGKRRKGGEKENAPRSVSGGEILYDEEPSVR